MKLDDLRTLYSYNRWATHQLLVACRWLSVPAFACDLGTSHRSVRGTLVHTLWAEWIWLQRWRGMSPKQMFAEDFFPDIDGIEIRWADVERDREDFLASLADDRLLAKISYENLEGQRWEYALSHMMQHVVNHSTYHRGQVVTLLWQLGQTPPATDYLVYFDQGGR